MRGERVRWYSEVSNRGDGIWGNQRTNPCNYGFERRTCTKRSRPVFVVFDEGFAHRAVPKRLLICGTQKQHPWRSPPGLVRTPCQHTSMLSKSIHLDRNKHPSEGPATFALGVHVKQVFSDPPNRPPPRVTTLFQFLESSGASVTLMLQHAMPAFPFLPAVGGLQSPSRDVSRPEADVGCRPRWTDTVCVLSLPVPCRSCRCRCRAQPNNGKPRASRWSGRQGSPHNDSSNNDNVNQTAGRSNGVHLFCRRPITSHLPHSSSELLLPYDGLTEPAHKNSAVK